MNQNSEHLPGAVGGATRVGRTVRRPVGEWTPAVHDLLNFLNAEGLRGIPQVNGIDDEGRENLTYVEGRGVVPDKEIVLDNVLVEAVEWLREYHDLVEEYRPGGTVRWRYGEAELAPDQIICHNDPGVYNWIIQSGHFAALIDWDMAGPGSPLDDIAFLIWTGLPLYRDIGTAETARRLELVVDAYGEYGPITLLNGVVSRMRLAADRIEAGIARGDKGIANLQKVGEPQRTRDRVDAFEQRIDAILDAMG